MKMQMLFLFLAFLNKVDAQEMKGSADVDTKKEKIWAPGTKYCGIGNVPLIPDSWAVAEATDKCCKNHDGCTQRIMPYHKRFHLFNNNYHTVNTCECDATFHACLKEVDTWFSKSIGQLFFDTLKIECFNIGPGKYCGDHWIWKPYNWLFDKCSNVVHAREVGTWGKQLDF
jgi:secretory phospholipase A2